MELWISAFAQTPILISGKSRGRRAQWNILYKPEAPASASSSFSGLHGARMFGKRTT